MGSAWTGNAGALGQGEFMLKSRVIKTAYTGLSLTDIGFSGRILEKYRFFNDNYLTGLAMIFRKDKAQGRTGGTVVYKNNFHHTFLLRFNNSYSLANHISEPIPYKKQPEESGIVDRDSLGPG
ncbi:MAG: hypothetical protein ABFD08_08605, partial [Syntrophomonas sp.]